MNLFRFVVFADRSKLPDTGRKRKPSTQEAAVHALTGARAGLDKALILWLGVPVGLVTAVTVGMIALPERMSEVFPLGKEVAKVDRISSAVIMPQKIRKVQMAATLREKPSANSKSRGRVEPGTFVEVFGGEPDWSRVRLVDGREGFLPDEAIERPARYVPTSGPRTTITAERQPAGPRPRQAPRPRTRDPLPPAALRGVNDAVDPERSLVNPPEVPYFEERTWVGTKTTPDGFEFSFELTVEGENDRISGTIRWTLRAAPEESALVSRIGEIAIETVEGRFDPSTRQLTLAGVRSSDEALVPADRYRFRLSPDLASLTGEAMTRQGDWSATLSGNS